MLHTNYEFEYGFDNPLILDIEIKRFFFPDSHYDGYVKVDQGYVRIKFIDCPRFCLYYPSLVGYISEAFASIKVTPFAKQKPSG